MNKKICLTMILCLILVAINLNAAPENWDYFRVGGRDIHAIAQEDSILWIVTDIGLVKLNLDTGEKEFIDVRDGLPYSMITSISIDSEGNKWFGTGEGWLYAFGAGVMKFDGTTWDVFNKDNSGLVLNGIWDVFVDSSGIVWAGGGEALSCMICSYDGTDWTRHFDADIPNKKVYCFEEDDKGNLWIGTAGGLLQYDGSDFVLYNTRNSPLPSVHVHDLVYTDGKLWMALYGGVMCKEDTVWTLYDTDNSSLPHHEVYTITKDTQGNIWAGTFAGLAKFDGLGWSPDTSIPQQKVRTLFGDDRGGLWAGTFSYDIDHGLYKKRNNGWVKYATYTNGLHTGHLNCVRVDRDNNKWFGTEEGLIKYDGLHWVRYDESNTDMRYVRIQDLELDAQGDLWMSTVASYPVGMDPYGDLVRYNGTSWDSLKLSTCGLNTTYVYSITFSPFGELWITTNNGAASYDGNSWINYTVENNTLPHKWVYAVCPLVDEVWFGTYLGLVRLNGDGVEVFNHENSVLPHPTVLALLHDGHKLWISTKGGVVTYDGTNWETFTPYNSIIPGNWTFDMQLLGQDIWMATNMGVFRYSGDAWTRYATSNSGLLYNNVTGVAIDTFQNIWMTCPDEGLSIYNDDIPQSSIKYNDNASLPVAFELAQNYPNPFNPTTTITFTLPNDGNVAVDIFDMNGRKITTLLDERMPAGSYDMIWNAAGMPSGIYICRMLSNGQSATKKMILMK